MLIQYNDLSGKKLFGPIHMEHRPTVGGRVRLPGQDADMIVTDQPERTEYVKDSATGRQDVIISLTLEPEKVIIDPDHGKKITITKREAHGVRNLHG